MSARLCGAAAVFWPDVEGCDAVCDLPDGHEPANVHEDPILGEWNHEDLTTMKDGELL